MIRKGVIFFHLFVGGTAMGQIASQMPEQLIERGFLVSPATVYGLLLSFCFVIIFALSYVIYRMYRQLNDSHQRVFDLFKEDIISKNNLTNALNSLGDIIRSKK